MHSFAFNRRRHLNSNKLQSASVPGRQPDLVSGVFVSGKVLHIRSARPEELPHSAGIYSLTGQKIGEVSLEKEAENTLQLDVASGLYFLVIKTESGPQTIRFQVL